MYGYSVTIGPDGKPKVRQFGNVKSPGSRGGFGTRPQFSAEREPLADIINSDQEVKVVVELPGISKENLKVNAYDNSVEIFILIQGRENTGGLSNLPTDADIETARLKL